MKIGIDAELTDQTLPVTELAPLVEAAGLDALLLVYCSHRPAASEDSTPGPDHAEDSRYLDPISVLGAAASVTTSLRLGMGALYPVFYDPIILARALATLDHLSDGRLLVGVTPGYDENRFRNHGVDYETRFGAFREMCLAIRALWTEPQAEFHGEYVDFDPVVLGVIPRQQPHPPLMIGSHGPHGLRRVAEFGDAWLPVMHGGLDLEGDMARLAGLCADAGRSPAPVTVFMWQLDEVALERCAAAGVERCVVDLFPRDRATVDAFLERLAPMVDRFRD